MASPLSIICFPKIHNDIRAYFRQGPGLYARHWLDNAFERFCRIRCRHDRLTAFHGNR